MIALDASLVSTGYAYRHSGDVWTGIIQTKKLRGPERLEYITDRVEEILSQVAPELVVYEGYAMGIRGGGRVFDIGELGGVLKALIWRRGIDLLIVPPTVLKKHITGTGKSDKKDKKAAIILALKEKYGYIISQNDEADAAALLFMGEELLAIDDPITWADQNKCTYVKGKG